MGDDDLKILEGNLLGVCEIFRLMMILAILEGNLLWKKLMTTLTTQTKMTRRRRRDRRHSSLPSIVNLWYLGHMLVLKYSCTKILDKGNWHAVKKLGRIKNNNDKKNKK